MNRMTPEQADEFRRPVLDALGHDDPFTVQDTELEHWRRLIDQAGAHLRTRPAEGEWSVLECLGHMTDSELVTSGRYRWVLAESEPTLIGFDQTAWVARLNHSAADPVALLDLFGALRRANLTLWRTTPPSDRARAGLHAERGPESFELLFRMQAGHGRVHRAQAERALATVRRPRPVG
jgi:DinB superfamily